MTFYDRISEQKRIERKIPLEYKARIMDEDQIRRSLARITHEIIEKNQGAENICLLGIKTRGVPISRILADNIKKFEGIDVPVGYIDITSYRDDISEPTLVDDSGCHIPCDVKDHDIIIVDDVMYTGRTCRAAIEAVFRHGRPRSIQLAVLVDRGHRELPIRADFVGKNIPTAKNEKVAVKLNDTDGECFVAIYNA